MKTSYLRKNIFLKILKKCQKNVTETQNNYRAAQDRANEEEGAMHSRYSTFKEEGQYLAEGLKNQYNKAVQDLENAKMAIAHCETFKPNGVIRVGSMVGVEDENGKTEKYFFFPALGGEEICGFKIVMPASPLGKKLFRKEEGDDFTIKIDGVVKCKEVVLVE